MNAGSTAPVHTSRETNVSKTLCVRIVRPLSGELHGVDLSRLKVGAVYELADELAQLLIAMTAAQGVVASKS